MLSEIADLRTRPMSDALRSLLVFV